MDQNIFQTVYKVNHAGGSGSCFYLKKHDLFVTNYHVVEGFRQVALEDNQKNRYLANIVLVNPILDIALLSAEGDFTALPEISLACTEVTLGQKINVAGLSLRDAVYSDRRNRLVSQTTDGRQLLYPNGCSCQSG